MWISFNPRAHIVESNEYSWTARMKELLLATCKKVLSRKGKKLGSKEYIDLQKQHRSILKAGYKELPPIPANPTGKRGKLAKSDAHNLWERLKKYESSVLLFAKKAEVSFTK